MDSRLHKAIQNDIGLYQAIFRSHHLEFTQTEDIGYCLGKSPPQYSNIVTCDQNWKPDDTFSKIDANYEDSWWEGWSIKDSFSILELSADGFTKLFEAQWIYLPANDFTPVKTGGRIDYKVVENKAGLSAWRVAWDSNEQLGKAIFDPGLLGEDHLQFIAGYQDGQLVSGCLANQMGGTLGISNFFAPSGDLGCWSDMLSYLLSLKDPMDIVGFEDQKLVERLGRLGFQAVGELIVWMKRRVNR